MKIVFTNTLSKKENIGNEKMEIIRSVVKGIFTLIKGVSLPKYSRLIKIYVTTVKGARRAVFLADMLSGKNFFLFYRSKNDEIGKNMSVKNPKFKNELIKYLQILRKDIEANELEIFEL